MFLVTPRDAVISSPLCMSGPGHDMCIPHN